MKLMKLDINKNIYSEEKKLIEKLSIIKKKDRNSSFELLRIILITLIVLHHIFINLTLFTR